jgi:transcriptional regulator with XRE-family HTH domain
MSKEKLIELREKMGTLKLTEALGIGRSTLTRYLNGKLDIPLSVGLALETIERRISETEKSESLDTISLLIDSSGLDKDRFEEFGKKLKQVRQGNSMERAYFARISEVGLPYLTNLENGKKSNMTLSTIRKIAATLKNKIEIIIDCRQ